MSSENQVHLIGAFRREEAVAAGTITPGMLVEEDSSGEFQAHSTEGGYAARRFAEIDALQGRTLDDDYSADDLVSANVELVGNEVNAFIKAGEDIAIGDFLISAGDGTLIENGSESSVTTVRQVIGYAREAQDLTGSGAVDTLTRIMLL